MIPNNILGEEDLNPQGFHRWPAGSRITTMMTPTIVLRTAPSASSPAAAAATASAALSCRR
jgi:hypothetical protein